MANMDYPGPCPSCLGIDGCSNEAAKIEGVKHYCKGLEMELNSWKARLYDALVAAEGLSASDADKFNDSMALIKSTMKELDRVAEQMQNECPPSMSEQEKAIGNKLEEVRVNYTKALGVISPGWFGG